MLYYLILIQLVSFSITTVSVKSNSPDLQVTYMTLVEGTSDIYETCKLICSVNEMKTYYSETTIYPNYGKLFRCQCDDDFTPWYSLDTLAEVTKDLLKGNPLFNYYMNMVGNYKNECECENLKSLIYNIVDSFKNVNDN